MSSGSKVKTVQVHCAATKQMVQDFKIAPLESHDLILKNIRQRLGISFAAVYSQDAKQAIDDLKNAHEGQILVVSSNPLQRPQPYAPPGFKLYRGEESADAHPSYATKPFDVSDLHFVQPSSVNIY